MTITEPYEFAHLNEMIPSYEGACTHEVYIVSALLDNGYEAEITLTFTADNLARDGNEGLYQYKIKDIEIISNCCDEKSIDLLLKGIDEVENEHNRYLLKLFDLERQYIDGNIAFTKTDERD